MLCVVWTLCKIIQLRTKKNTSDYLDGIPVGGIFLVDTLFKWINKHFSVRILVRKHHLMWIVMSRLNKCPFHGNNWASWLKLISLLTTACICHLHHIHAINMMSNWINFIGEFLSRQGHAKPNCVNVKYEWNGKKDTRDSPFLSKTLRNCRRKKWILWERQTISESL